MRATDRHVRIWRTGDGGGIDGGGLLTVELDYPGRRVRLGSLHQGFDDFIRDSATCRIDAAVEALRHVTAVVNRRYATFLTATATKTDGHTIGGDQQVYGLVEWDGSYRPTVIVGCCRPSCATSSRSSSPAWPPTVASSEATSSVNSTPSRTRTPRPRCSPTGSTRCASTRLCRT